MYWMKLRESVKKYKWVLIILSTSYVVLLSIPIPSFPLTHFDEHLYYAAAENLVVESEVRIPSSVFPSFIAQLFIGYVFAKTLGLSYFVLKLSTITLAGLGVLFLFFFLREFFEEKTAAAGSLLLLSNPIYFTLARTYMTDVPALVFTVASLLFFLRSVKHHDRTLLLAASLLLTVAVLIRQFYILVGLSMLALVYFRTPNRKELLNQLAVLSVPFLFLAVWAYWLVFYHGLPVNTYIFAPSLINTANNITKGVFYAGLFFFPLVPFFLLRMRRSLRLAVTYKPVALVTAAVLVLFIAFRLLSTHGFWIPGAVVHPNGIGPAPMEKPYILSVAFWPVLLLALVGSFLVLNALFRKEHGRLLVLVLPFYAFNLLIGISWDRYFLFVFVAIIPIALKMLKDLGVKEKHLFVALLLVSAWMWYGAYDNYQWNTAKYEMTQRLSAQGIQCDTAGYTCDGVEMSFQARGEVLDKIDYFGPFGERLGALYATRIT